MSDLLFFRIYKGDELTAVKQFETSQVVLGSKADVTLSLQGEGIAPVHASIEERGDDFFITDLGSETGTRLNSKNIVEEKLFNGDSIEIGEYRIEFFIGIPTFAGVSPEPKVTAEKKTDDAPKAEEIVPPQPPAPVAPPEPKAEQPSQERLQQEPKPTSTPPAESPQAAPPPQEAAVDNVLKPIRVKQTYAPKSSYENVDEIIKPSKGSLVEIVVTWGDRVLTTYHCNRRGVVRFGSHPKNDIILPTLGSQQASLPLLDVQGNETKIFIHPFCKGQLYHGDMRSSIVDLQKRGKLHDHGKIQSYSLLQGEMLRLDLGEGVSLFVRYISPTPKPLMIPFFGLTSTELTGILIAVIVGAILYLLSNIEPDLVEEEPKDEVKITQFIFKKEFPKPTPVPRQQVRPKSTPKPKPQRITKVADKNKAPLVKKVRNESRSGGAAARARPNESRSKKQQLTADKKSKSNNTRVDSGGVKSNRSKNAGTTEKRNVKQTGLLGAFSRGGAQQQLAKTNQGLGEIAGLSQSATGEAGSGGDGPVSDGLRQVGKGDKGTAKIGIADIGTQGRGGGQAGYGSGSVGTKQSADIDIQASDLESEGTIDREAILRVIRNGKSQIQACYERELNKDPNLFGTVRLNWEIIENGKVGKIRVDNSTLNNSRVENCIISRFKAWRFPEPPPNTIAELYYRFVFAAK